MNGQWKEVARISFKGKRFHDHALELRAIAELGQFQKIITETAKALWKQDNPLRERLPKLFEERTILYLRRIEDGSAVAPLEVFEEESKQVELFDSETIQITEALKMAQNVYEAVEKEEPLPENFPRSLLPEYEKWGQFISEDEEMEIIYGSEKKVSINQKTSLKISALMDYPHEAQIQISGEVLEADIRQGRFQIWTDENTKIIVNFTADQEDEVTNALRNHKNLRLSVLGRGEYSPLGKPLRVTRIEKLEIQSLSELSYDEKERPIEDILEEIAKGLPKEEWEKLPADLTDKIDFYLYGSF